MYTIDKNYENLIEIKKSKFITYAFPVATQEGVDEILKKLRKDHKEATHVCFAYVLSSPNLEKASDDGEPDGTAGKPILDVIKKNDLHDVLFVVVRYFGGIKLGAGGLVRAYSTSAGDIVKLCKLGTTSIMTEFKITTEIKNAKNLLEIFRKNDIYISSQEYTEKYTARFFAENIKFLSNLSFDINTQEIQKVKVFHDKDK